MTLLAREKGPRTTCKYNPHFGSVIAGRVTEAKSAIPGMFCLRAFTSPDRGSLRHITRVGMPAILLMLAAGAAQASGPVFSATLGGSGQDFALAVTSDAQGNTYVAGLTY